MSKEKTRIEKEKNYDIYYEIIGLGAIFLTLIIIAEIGLIGSGLKMIFKILVGDWYFILLLFFFIGGFFIVFKKKKINIFTLQFNGFILFMVSLMLLSHHSFYPFAKTKDNNQLVGMWTIYQAYLKNPDTSYIYGGGIIGGFIYQILFYLFGEIGSLLIIILLLSFSIIFMTDNNLYSFYKLFRKGLTKAILYLKKFFSYFSKIEKREKKKVFTLSESKENMNLMLQKKVAKDTAYGLENMLYVIKITNYEIMYHVSYLYTQYVIKVEYYQVQAIEDKIKEIIKGKNHLYFKGALFVEVENQFKDLLTLKHQIDLTKGLSLGLDIELNPFSFSILEAKSILIRGDQGSGVRNFLRNLIAQTIVEK